MDMQYSMLTWLILFSYFLMALQFGIREQLQYTVISNVIFFKLTNIFLTKSEPQYYS